MAGIVLEKGKVIYTYGQPMTALHLIMSGSVSLVYPGGSTTLSKGDVIGICEICSEIHLLEYRSDEETQILTYPIASLDSLSDILQKHPDLARLFLLSCFKQIVALLSASSLLGTSCSNLYRTLTEDVARYRTLCERYRVSSALPAAASEISAYLGDEDPDLWLTDYYMGLKHILSGTGHTLFVQEPGLPIGMLRKGSLDFRRTYLSLEEQHTYLRRIVECYFNESGDDLYSSYTALTRAVGADSADGRMLTDALCRFSQECAQTKLLSESFLFERTKSLGILTANQSSSVSSSAYAEDAAELSDSLKTILSFAQASPELSASFHTHILAYRALHDRSSMDEDCLALKKALTKEFYELYALLFEQTLHQASVPMPVWMFLTFGYADEHLAGEENAAALLRLMRGMQDHSNVGIYTFYDWLLAIYRGHKVPSRNEFDLDYTDDLRKKRTSGAITQEELSALEQDGMAKVRFELSNMFPQVNKITFGRVLGYCPIFCADDVLKKPDDSIVTASRLLTLLDELRSIDYTAFYRERHVEELPELLGKEFFHTEVLPDIILMPNVGVRGVMWQEIEGKRRGTPARMMVSILHMEDLKTTFVHLVGEFRWELCKRVQGNRWNDVSEPSLTSEYYDYIQFYRKNHDLSTEAKEKVRTSLQRAKNSFKEMFVRDYMIWVLFEGEGSPRLNKVARSILFTYCPFSSEAVRRISMNPLYAELLDRRRIRIGQGLHHLDALERKIIGSGATVPQCMNEERYYLSGEKSYE